MKFNTACAFVLKWEGQISESPSDPGGLTKFGISSRQFPEVRKLEFSEADAIAIYKEKYWTACKCEELPEALAFMLFDAAVNQGQTQAIRMLQRTINVPADGVMGPETIAAAGLAMGECLQRNQRAQHRLRPFTAALWLVGLRPLTPPAARFFYRAGCIGGLRNTSERR